MNPLIIALYVRFYPDISMVKAPTLAGVLAALGAVSA